MEASNDHLIVYVLDDDDASADVIAQMVLTGYPEAEVKIFNDHQQFLESPELCAADLFIVDIRLTNFDGRDLPGLMPMACLTKPFLFVSGYTIQDDQFDRVENLIHYDFVEKPFTLRKFVHRIAFMIQTRPAIFHRLQDDVFSLITYTPYVAVVLDAELKVRYCNRQTLALLEVEKPADIVGHSWLNYIPNEAALAVMDVHGALLSGDTERFDEYVNEIQTIGGIRKTVRWWNTPFEGHDGESLTLSIGASVLTKRNMAEELRATFRQTILKDKANIRAVKRFKLKSLSDVSCGLTP